ncbi:MAG: hypothetical protein RIR97_840, partial [Pseudomonadota bacterium]
MDRSKADIQVLWFKRDLRVADHAALRAASEAGPVLPIYIFEPEYWSLPDSSSRHWTFVRDCLTDLHTELVGRGAPLTFRIGSAVEVMEQLRQQLGPFTLWSHEETGNLWTYQRDRQVKHWASAHDIVWNEIPSHGVVRRLSDRNRWSRLRDERLHQTPLAAPPVINPVADVASDAVPTGQHRIFGQSALAKGQTGGLVEGRKVLDSFLKERGRNYLQTISKPGISARHCSR